MDHLERDKPDIMCIVETKLTPNIQVDWFGDGNYRLWRKDRMTKGGGSIIVLTRKDLTVKNVSLGREGEEVVGLVVTDRRQDINIVTVYVPPKSAWPNEQYDDMWVRHPTRGQQGDTPLRLNLIFAKGVQLGQGIEHECPLGKSNHKLLKFCLDVGLRVENGDGYKEERLNYARVRYNYLRRYSGNMDWSAM
ncbi:hypothetical protein E2C01_038331 [Portunus trituberculatus]|uniref:Uncharacterized protein n=1 Tax=Portunus trituberculatus TaxID=210409 RepID=A0A5B7FHQ5_PORTR|nr:hypothetical protein [Portunus trituberculatus]